MDGWIHHPGSRPDLVLERLLVGRFRRGPFSPEKLTPEPMGVAIFASFLHTL